MIYTKRLDPNEPEIKLSFDGDAADILVERLRRAGGIARSADQDILAQLIRNELRARDIAVREAEEETRRLRDQLQSAINERDKWFAEAEGLRRIIAAKDVEIQSHKAEISWRIQLMKDVSTPQRDEPRHTNSDEQRITDAIKRAAQNEGAAKEEKTNARRISQRHRT